MEMAVQSERPDRIFHLGDYISDARDLHYAFSDIPMDMVAGNCDWGTVENGIRIMEYEGVRIYMTHGHLHDVKSTDTKIHADSLRAGAEVAVYGHTHRARCENRAGVWLLNPGSCSGIGAVSYGIILLKNKKPTCYYVIT